VLIPCFHARQGPVWFAVTILQYWSDGSRPALHPSLALLGHIDSIRRTAYCVKATSLFCGVEVDTTL
jgi:hypothetical protein